ncbi:uncharacterized protein LOC123442936 [Hordeum vulgare subsp. vulgare]|uniref:uncharacterized protein LOC123442936 n=1 Tax=Hordeum vulgare subsp. vulgare TaxID=112509 RepID=UPI001D1A41F8|nr:uncharacterized protein LOC123442936 [Hordeum vulgare subsp. vulgare]
MSYINELYSVMSPRDELNLALWKPIGGSLFRLQGGRDIPLCCCAARRKSPQNCRRADCVFNSRFKRTRRITASVRHPASLRKRTTLSGWAALSSDLTPPWTRTCKPQRRAPRGLGLVGAHERELGGLFSGFDCTMVFVRQEEDSWNSIATAGRSTLMGNCLLVLALIEGAGLMLNRDLVPP